MLFKFQTFAFKPKVCEMGGNFWFAKWTEHALQGVACSPRPKKTHAWSQLDALYDFQNL